MKALVVFYSRTGFTTKVGKEIAQNIKADIEELHDTKNRRGFFGYLFAGRDALRKRLTTIKPTVKNPSKYDIIILGSPNWGSKMAPATRTYIEKNKKSFKKIALFCTQGGAGGQGLLADMAKCCGKTSIAEAVFGQKTPREEMKQEIYSFIKRIK